MANEVVSIILCTYNGALYVKEQLDSIIRQTYPSLEIIIADDASTDDTWTILESIAKEDERIRLYRNEKNLGFNVNFSQACEKATGEYIAIADQDDIWEAEKIAVLVDAIDESKEIMLVHCISARFEEKGKPHLRSLRWLNYFNGNDIRYFMLSNYVSGHNMLFRKELLQASLPFPPNMYYDWWLAAVACCSGGIGYVSKVLAYHRLHEKNASGFSDYYIPFYKHVLETLPVLLTISCLPSNAKKFGEELLEKYRQLNDKKYSLPLHLFILKHAAIIFSFKKKTLSILFLFQAFTKDFYSRLFEEGALIACRKISQLRQLRSSSAF